MSVAIRNSVTGISAVVSDETFALLDADWVDASEAPAEPGKRKPGRPRKSD